ncbi:DUF4097 family beta strand repeat protein [Microvirga sp. STR05]|uniref:DUF4097 family beta strand repeat protein n=1 Tax=Hymenobacter duratus TaxID=2771356 RepID=A0ABR8JL38_9BACT|nr:DUF4097 family beta strand repeat-containing protein [Hymenobacter duratus]MBD2715254.1 DUF4097 family beta strand repeat protein [Hymenobacter duratus]MBR7950161.1 DUF4097 family beta strand repeat protein [Microvirga sp. STR05]
MKYLFLILLMGGAATCAAQAPVFQIRCETSTGNQLQKTYCETRDLSLPAPAAGTPLTVDARLNGGIVVRGWSGSTVRVRARVQGQSGTLEAARAVAAAVQISSTGNTLRASRANGSLEDWGVSYEVFVPTQTSLALTATNGSIRLENVQGTITFETTNGSVELAGVGGDVRGKTTNGRLNVAFTGAAWAGPGLDVKTTNGGATCQLPASYAGILVARTSHGRVTASLVPAVRKLLQAHSLTATFGKGGPQLRVSTVNGSIAVKQEGAGQKNAPEPEPKQEE